MRKILISILAFSSFSYAFASSCVDLPKNLSKGAESTSVLSFQAFLYEKGFLKVKPNGYFGPGTVSAVKAYQKSLGYSQTGVLGPVTRASLKKESCSTVKTANTPATSVVSSSSTQATIASLSAAIPPAITLSAIDATVPYGGAPRIVYSSQNAASCRLIPTSQKWVSTELFGTIRDENATTTQTYTLTCTGSGGVVTKSVTVKVLDQKDTVVVYPIPYLDSLNNGIYFAGGSSDVSLVISGNNFATSTNSVVFTKSGSNVSYIISTSSPSGDQKTITIPSRFTTATYPSGGGTYTRLPAGYYDVTIRNKGGESNAGKIAIKDFVTNSVSGSPNYPITPKQKAVNLGTISFSSTLLVSLNSITFTLAGSNPQVAGSISGILLKDTATASTTPGPVVNFQGKDLYENQSKIYEIYGDVSELAPKDAGSVTFNGIISVTDYITKMTTKIPIPPFSVSVSY